MLAVLAAAFWGVKASGLLDLMKDYDKFKAFIEGYGALGYLIYIFIFIIIAVFSIPVPRKNPIYAKLLTFSHSPATICGNRNEKAGTVASLLFNFQFA